MTRIGVLGAGSWGTTLADLLARKGHEVRLWAYEVEVVESINLGTRTRSSSRAARSTARLVACADPFEAVAGAAIVLSAAPSHVVRSVAAPLAPGIAAGRHRGQRHQGDRVAGIAAPARGIDGVSAGSAVRGPFGPELCRGGV